LQERIREWRRKFEVKAEGRLRKLHGKKKKKSGTRNYEG
jgi:hypothetical protein